MSAINQEFLALPGTRKKAIEAGSSLYFTGKQCAHGHVHPRHTKDGRCAVCRVERNRIYREENRDSVLEAQRQYNAENADRKRKYMRDRYSNNKDEISGKNKVAARKWRQRNKSILAAKTAKYLADKKQATPKWANMEAIGSIYKQAESIRLSTGKVWHVDHIVPLNSVIVCGLHCEANLQILPGMENVQKSNKYWPDMP